jgi:hypothetical protein
MKKKLRNVYQGKNKNVILGYFVVSRIKFRSTLIGQIFELLTPDGKESNNCYLEESYGIDHYHLV